MQCSELNRVALKGVFARKQLNKIGAKPFKIQRWEKPFFFINLELAWNLPPSSQEIASTLRLTRAFQYMNTTSKLGPHAQTNREGGVASS
jgi:hypothetical protein